MPRCFVAIRPPGEVLDAIAAIPRPETDGVRWTHLEQWHVTLAFLGDVDEQPVASALGRVDHPAVRVRLGPAVTTIRDEVVVVPASGLDDLADAVAVATRPIAPDLPRRRFRGHLTLARARSRPPDVVGHPVDVSFDVTEFVLMRSELLPEGARHHEVARFALSPAEDGG